MVWHGWAIGCVANVRARNGGYHFGVCKHVNVRYVAVEWIFRFSLAHFLQFSRVKGSLFALPFHLANLKQRYFLPRTVPITHTIIHIIRTEESAQQQYRK